MTLVALPATPLWETFSNSNSAGAFVIDANGEKAAYIFQVPKSGTIDRVCFRTTTVTVGDTVDVRLESVAADGTPSGSLFAANTNVSQLILLTDDNTWFECTLTAGAAVTRGDWVAVVVALPAAGSTGNLSLLRLSSGGAARPYTALYTGTWAKSVNAPVGAVGYSDATYPLIPGLFPLSATPAQTTYNDSSNPDERGNKITIPFPCKVWGVWSLGSGGSHNGDFTFKLYNAADSVLESIAVDGDTIGTNLVREFVPFDTEVTLAAGDVVRLTKLATTETNTSLLDHVAQTGLGSALPMGTQSVYTTRNNSGGSWTDVSDKQVALGLIISALDDGAGGGSSTHAYGFVG